MGFRAFVLFLILILSAPFSFEYGWTREPVDPPPLWVVGRTALPIVSLSQAQIIHILSLDRRIWNNGHSIRVALLSDMLKKDDQWVRWLGLPSVEPFLARWIEANLIQDWPTPNRFANLDELLEFVRQTPGAVGFTNIQPTSLPPDIRTIRIDDTESRRGS